MKNFLFNNLLLAILIVLIFIIELLLPHDFFTFRVWEALSVKSIANKFFYGEFYPNKMIERDEVGDLAHHTKYKKIKHVVWKTDKLGYRNSNFINNPDVLLIGDSFVLGTALSQENTLGEHLKELMGLRVYSINGSIYQFYRLYGDHIIEKPKVIIWESLEYLIPRLEKKELNYSMSPLLRMIKLNPFFNYCFEIADRIYKQNMFHFIASRIMQKKGLGQQSPIADSVFFFGIDKAFIPDDDDIIKKVVDNISYYNDQLKEMNIKLIFMPMPNKETVYYNLVPLESEPRFLYKLDSALREAGVSTINVLKLYRDSSCKDQYLYHLDDAHWNETGIKIAAVKLSEQLKQEIVNCR